MRSTPETTRYLILCQQMAEKYGAHWAEKFAYYNPRRDGHKIDRRDVELINKAQDEMHASFDPVYDIT